MNSNFLYLFFYLLLWFVSLPIFSAEEGDIVENIDTSEFETVIVGPDMEKSSVSQAFLNMAYQFLEKNNKKKAKEYFEKCVLEEDGEISRKARLALIHLKASSGEKSLLLEIEVLDENEKLEAYFMLADGWENYYFENPYKIDYLNKAKEYYAFLVARYKGSILVQKARLKLASLYIEEKKYNFALDNLLPLLKKSKKYQKLDVSKIDKGSIGFDMAWFLLGRLLEESNQYKDYERAVDSYSKVLHFSNSPFIESAKKRIKYLKKTFLLI